MTPDLVVRGGTVYDGTGRAGAAVDVIAHDGKIAEIGKAEVKGRREIDARGLAVAPGFIDIHSHSDYTLLADPRAVSAIHQGVTTEVIGNCGFGCFPIRDPKKSQATIYGYNDQIPLTWRDLPGYFDALAAAKPAVNVATLVPNGQLRHAAIGKTDREASADELADMGRLLEDGLAAGAFGYSTGLEYPVEVAATEAEVTALARIAGRRGALYATHTRNRDEGSLPAIDEALRTAKAANVRLQLSHLIPRAGLAVGERSIAMIDRARRDGLDVAFDMHTRLYGTTMLASLLPPWATEGGKAGLLGHLGSRESRERMKRFRSIVSGLNDWSKVVLLDLSSHPELSRKNFVEIGRMRGQDPHDAAFDILRDEIDTPYRPMVILLSYHEESQRAALGHPLCMPASDATTLAPDGPLAASVFHGAYTWAAWFWRFMVRETRLLDAAAAVHKLTGLPAQVMGFAGRGTISVGHPADLAVFDPDRFGERGTTFEPNRLAEGMRHVTVNGVVTLSNGALTGERGGAIIRREPGVSF
jgi:N-acyl-D-aspartate/D-glutamate deacylase